MHLFVTLFGFRDFVDMYCLLVLIILEAVVWCLFASSVKAQSSASVQMNWICVSYISSPSFQVLWLRTMLKFMEYHFRTYFMHILFQLIWSKASVFFISDENSGWVPISLLLIISLSFDLHYGCSVRRSHLFITSGREMDSLEIVQTEAY